jgi:hypothetical protein
MLRSLPTGKPLGLFNAVCTRDGEALAQTGKPYFAMNAINTSNGREPLVEIQFADGFWMLAEHEDLEPLVEGRASLPPNGPIELERSNKA